jgi:hypothetical protein
MRKIITLTLLILSISCFAQETKNVGIVDSLINGTIKAVTDAKNDSLVDVISNDLCNGTGIVYNDVKELTVNVYSTIKEDVVKQTPEKYNVFKDKLSRCLEIINE